MDVLGWMKAHQEEIVAGLVVVGAVSGGYLMGHDEGAKGWLGGAAIGAVLGAVVGGASMMSLRALPERTA